MYLRWEKRDIFMDIFLLPKNLAKPGLRLDCLIGGWVHKNDVAFHALLGFAREPLVIKGIRK
jgi:hypothetical protein